MYKTVVYFEDLQDNRYAYNPGDTFPRNGFEVSKERLEELSTNKNRRGVALIEKVQDEIIAPDEPIPETVEEVAEEETVKEPVKPKRNKKRR